MAEVSLTEADNGKLVTLQQGDELVVALRESPASTGFQWEREAGRGSKLAAASETYRASAGGVGAGGLRIIRLTASAAGTEELRLKLFRPDGAVERWFTVTVTIGGRVV